MAVNPQVEGRTYPPAAPYVVSRAKIAEFATAVGAVDEAHFDVAVARGRGYADVIAPPTLAVLIAQRGEAAVMRDPDAGVDYSRLVHGEEGFVHHRPLVAGDEVQPVTTIERVRSAGGHSMMTMRTVLQTLDGEAVTTTTSMVVIRGDEQ
ncbi:FAS1-like dehydratase domain-containing protein [Rudaeicoccus suwonensis]|uniref:Acyl dehydratase n=1 Tax=Rudaeicoccus suwonensis TaxID=657409 RepID=A0A561E7K1_9MICO|nr:MaoC family dehydratase N-terminal domain-containing protein [Rudaeicoccus suwonensis]TWE11603.1 acyl dehydratase [Rudaeicoccus suwonensis]